MSGGDRKHGFTLNGRFKPLACRGIRGICSCSDLELYSEKLNASIFHSTESDARSVGSKRSASFDDMDGDLNSLDEEISRYTKVGKYSHDSFHHSDSSYEISLFCSPPTDGRTCPPIISLPVSQICDGEPLKVTSSEENTPDLPIIEPPLLSNSPVVSDAVQLHRPTAKSVFDVFEYSHSHSIGSHSIEFHKGSNVKRILPSSVSVQATMRLIGTEIESELNFNRFCLQSQEQFIDEALDNPNFQLNERTCPSVVSFDINHSY